MDSERIKVGNRSVKVVSSEEAVISPDDKEMDIRVTAAVNSAIKKAKVCNKPIAKYDRRKKKAYVIQSNGEKKYVN